MILFTAIMYILCVAVLGVLYFIYRYDYLWTLFIIGMACKALYFITFNPVIAFASGAFTLAGLVVLLIDVLAINKRNKQSDMSRLHG